MRSNIDLCSSSKKDQSPQTYLDSLVLLYFLGNHLSLLLNKWLLRHFLHFFDYYYIHIQIQLESSCTTTAIPNFIGDWTWSSPTTTNVLWTWANHFTLLASLTRAIFDTLLGGYYNLSADKLCTAWSCSMKRNDCDDFMIFSGSNKWPALWTNVGKALYKLLLLL